MRYSILYKFEEKREHRDIIYNLSVDRCINNISKDDRKNSYFCQVLSEPLTSYENIEFRRSILKDFTANRNLFLQLKTLFTRYDKIKADWLEMKSSDTGTSVDKGSSAMLEYIYSSLKTTALFPKTIHSFLGSIIQTISEYSIEAEGLLSLKENAKKMIENSYLNEIVDIASQFMYNIPEDYDFSLKVTLGDRLNCTMADIYAIAKREKKKTGILNILTKKKDENKPVTDKSPFSHDTSLKILGEALYITDKLLEDITDNVYSAFYGISRELDFYEIALKYIDFIESTDKPLVYPEMGSTAIRCSELYDLLLVSDNSIRVYPNDADFGITSGVLIKGKNNTGKTTFLRSVVTAQLFAQAGLPVVAQKAELPIFNSFFTHFSSAEEEFESGDTSGRFEGEVKAVASIMNSLTDNCLVVLNETFQTTAYDEGCDAISWILKAINKCNSRFIFVTHLTDLFDLLDEGYTKLESVNGDNPFTIKKIRR